MATEDFTNDNNPDDRLNPYSENVRKLHNQETDAGQNEGPDEAASSTGEGGASGTSGASSTGGSNKKNIDATSAKERDGGGNFVNNFDGTGGSKKGKGFFGGRRKKGPMALILLLTGGGGFLISLVAIPSTLVEVVRHELTQKLGSAISSVVGTRTTLMLGDRAFSTTSSCRIKVYCRYSGLTQDQMTHLNNQGAQLLDKDGKPVTKSKLTGRYTGGKTMVLPSGERIDAKAYTKAAFTNQELRTTLRATTVPEYTALSDPASKDVRAEERLPTNPDWGTGNDDKTTRASVYKATSGDAYTANAEANTQYETDPKTGKQVPVPQDPSSQGLNFGDDTADINTQAQADQTAAAAGDPLPDLPSAPEEVAAMPDAPTTGSVTKGLKSVLGFLDPANIVVGLCVTYQLTNATIVAAKTIQLAVEMRYASLFLSTADKAQALPADNPLTSSDMSKAANILEAPNKSGENFQDAPSYQYAAYSTVTDQPLAASASGNDTIRLLSTIMSTINSALGGKTTIKIACNILTNPFVQGALALTSFIPGGQIGTLLKGIVSKGGAKLAKDAVTKAISSFVSKNLTKDTYKVAAKAAGKALWKLGRGPLALFLAGDLLAKYGIPYIARVISSTLLPNDGSAAMDNISTGTGAIYSATSQETGLPALTKDEYKASSAFYQNTTDTYVADMQAKANPFDLSNPYSKATAFSAAMYPLFSKFNVLNQGIAGILAAPATILSSLNPSNLLKSTSAFAATPDEELSACNDVYLQSHNIATRPDCTVIYGFNDTALLQSEDPSALVRSMHDSNQIDDDGNVVSGSELESFQNTCVIHTGPKFIGDVGDSTQQLDPSCYGTKNQTTQWKLFRLYTIDTISNANNEQ